MEKDTFTQNLIDATAVLLPFTREYLINSLPTTWLYVVFPNQSYDGNSLEGDEQLYPGDSLPPEQYVGPFDTEGAIKYLWRDGKIPEWVNLTVYSYDEKHTYVELLCCGRFTADQALLYHRSEGYPPFHVLGPPLPPDWESVEQNGKFDLFWNGKKRVVFS